MKGLYVLIESLLTNRFNDNINLPNTSVFQRKEVSKRVKEFVGEEGVKFIFTDGTYTATDYNGLQLLREKSDVDEELYRPEIHDCENFAYDFMGVASDNGVSSVGVVLDWSMEHAYNVVVLSDGRVKFYEPQDGSILDYGETHRIGLMNTEVTYEPTNATVLL